MPEGDSVKLLSRTLSRALDGACSLEQAVAETKRVTAAYARRQRTWFRRESATLRAPAPPDPERLAAAVRAWRR